MKTIKPTSFITTLLIVLLTAGRIDAQPYVFDGNTLPVHLLSYTCLDKTIDTSIRLTDLRRQKENVQLAQTIEAMPDKPTLIVAWKAERSVGHANTIRTARLIGSLISQHKRRFNIILVNINRPGDGFHIEKPLRAGEINSLNSALHWLNTPSFTDQFGRLQSTYMLPNCSLSFLVLDSQRHLVMYMNNMAEAKNKQDITKRLDEMRKKKFDYGQFYYDSTFTRVEGANEAAYRVSSESADDGRLKIVGSFIDTGKNFFEFSYRNNSSNPATGYPVFPEGPFLFEDPDSGGLSFKGDCYNGLINNLEICRGGKAVFTASGLLPLNQNISRNPEKIYLPSPGADKERFFRPAPEAFLSTITQYTADHLRSSVMQFDELRHKISETRFLESGRIGYERTWDMEKEYYPSGLPKRIASYNVEGRLHGKLMTYYENGNLKEVRVYNNGVVDLNAGESYHTDGKKKE